MVQISKEDIPMKKIFLVLIIICSNLTVYSADSIVGKWLAFRAQENDVYYKINPKAKLQTLHFNTNNLYILILYSFQFIILDFIIILIHQILIL